MLTTTSLKNPVFLARVKAAIVEAVKRAHRRGADIAHVQVKNKHGQPTLHVFAERGQHFTVDTHHGDNVTEIVLTALREYHSQPAPLPLIQIDFDSGPFWGISPCV